MQKSVYSCLFLSIVLIACNSNDRQASDTADSDVDAARSFIQAALVGDYERARTFMINDSVNLQNLNAIARLNERQSKEEKDRFQAASIRIHDDRKLNDSTSIVSYSNSYKNQVDSLKVVKANGKWLVDFKFLFNKTDSLP